MMWMRGGESWTAGLCALALWGCGSEGQDANTSDQGQDAQLARYRAALPGLEALQAPALAERSDKQVGDPALYPATSRDLVRGINGAVAELVQGLEAVVSLPPTAYDEARREFFWGPWPAEQRAGYVAAYIRETMGDDADFAFEYALLRTPTPDGEALTPVIVGGATPSADNPAHGEGLTLWDLEAEHAFASLHDPSYDADQAARGRFVAVYGQGPDEDDPTAELSYVVASMYHGEGAASQALRYLYGRHQREDLRLDFLHYALALNADEDAGGTLEQVDVGMAFVNGGVGRAEAVASGGSVEEAATLQTVECWDADVARTYLHGELVASASELLFTEGEATGCTAPFDQPLRALGVPRLDDLDPALLEQLDRAARDGL